MLCYIHSIICHLGLYIYWRRKANVSRFQGSVVFAANGPFSKVQLGINSTNFIIIYMLSCANKVWLRTLYDKQSLLNFKKEVCAVTIQSVIGGQET